MPTYEINDPVTGRTIELTGDSPPTEAELNEVFASVKDSHNSGGEMIDPDGDGPLPPQAVGLLRQLFGIKPSMMQKIGDALIQPASAIPGVDQFIGGVNRGTFRLTEDPAAAPAPAIGKMGEAVGRASLPAAGAIGAAALAPALVPAALTSAIGPTMAGLATGAAATGAGTMAGNTASQIAAKAMGGDAPDSIGEAALETGKVGLEAAAFELGGAGALTAIGKLAPAALQVFAKIPAESIKRAIQKPEVIRLGTQAQTRTEVGAARALRDAQAAINSARLARGRAVDEALKGFDKATGGARVIDASLAAANARAVLNDATGSAAARAALKASEIARIEKVIRAVEKNPSMTVAQTVQLRRNLDDLVKFKGGGLQDVSSDAGQRAIKEMGAALRESIDDAATRFNYTALRDANREFSKFAGISDEIAAELGTKGTTMRELRMAVERISGRFNKGGESARNIERLAERAPEMAGPINKLLDMVAARSLTKLPEGTPSGVWKDVLKFLQAPQVVGAGVKLASGVAPLGRVTRQGGSAAGAGL